MSSLIVFIIGFLAGTFVMALWCLYLIATRLQEEMQAHLREMEQHNKLVIKTTEEHLRRVDEKMPDLSGVELRPADLWIDVMHGNKKKEDVN